MKSSIGRENTRNTSLQFWRNHERRQPSKEWEKNQEATPSWSERIISNVFYGHKQINAKLITFLIIALINTF